MIFNELSTFNNTEYFLYMVRYFSNDAVTKFSLVLTTVDLFELVLLMFVDENVFCFISNMRLFQLFRLHVLALSLWATYALFIVSLSFSQTEEPLCSTSTLIFPLFFPIKPLVGHLWWIPLFMFYIFPSI